MKMIITALCVLASMNAYAAKIGAPAPDFTGKDLDGNVIKLSQYKTTAEKKGSFVVLEWHNKDCPYVKAQYGAGNLQKLQNTWKEKGVIWLSIVSSAPNKEGFVTPAQAKADLKETNSHPTAMILDTDGKIGHAYQAQTTPHLFVINPEGVLIYNGALDAVKAHEASEVLPTTQNWVSQALTEAMAGKEVSKKTSDPYGCSVKF